MMTTIGEVGVTGVIGEAVVAAAVGEGEGTETASTIAGTRSGDRGKEEATTTSTPPHKSDIRAVTRPVSLVKLHVAPLPRYLINNDRLSSEYLNAW